MTVVSVNNVDTLSTVALALAVLAFAAQLIVSLAQAQGAATQLSQTERINSDTQVVLADVRSTSRALLANQTDLLDRLLSAALPSATEAALREVANHSDLSGEGDAQASDQYDYEEFARQVEEKVRNNLRHLNVIASSDDSQRGVYPAWLDEPLGESSAAKAVRKLEALTGAELALFMRTVTRRVVNGSARTSAFSWVVYGGYDGRLPEPSRLLIDKGLLEVRGPVRTRENGRSHVAVKMTEDGTSVLRLILGKNPPNILYPALHLSTAPNGTADGG